MHPMKTFTHANSQFFMQFLIFIITFFITACTKANPNQLPSQFSKFSRNHYHQSSSSSNPNQQFDLSLEFTSTQTQWARAMAYNLTVSYHKSTQTHLANAMNDCLELLDDTLDQLSNVAEHKTINHNFDDIQTWLSAALTNQDTCLQSLESYKFYSEEQRSNFDSVAQNLSNLITNMLSLYVSKTGRQDSGLNRKLLSEADDTEGRFPDWVSGSERKLLEASVEDLGSDALVVAKDGSGTHSSISDALKSVGSMVPMAGDGKNVIYVKAGTYRENLKITTKQKNVMLVGDGKGITVIVGSKNSVDGSTTFQSATVGAMGDGFMARDITFINDAGPSKHQAVALRVGSDKSVVYRCSIVGYQDTLYTHSKRQFYRDTDIYGTVDFIFGNSAVVLQNCNIYVRKPSNAGNSNFVTAQGRTSEFQNTGISIHNCKIVPAGDFAGAKSKTKTFLGRPWQKYSRTVVMQSFLDDMISPSGWSPWSGSFALSTLYYAEYMNSGPGSSTSGRVKWGGFHASIATTDAQKFTVGGFIDGSSWLPSTGVSFNSGLVG